MYKGSIVANTTNKYERAFPWYARLTNFLFGWNWARCRYGFESHFRRLRYDASRKEHYIHIYGEDIYETKGKYNRFWKVLDETKVNV